MSESGKGAPGRPAAGGAGRQDLNAAMLTAPVPVFTFNSFVNALSASEVTSVLVFGPRPLVSLAMPLPVAKSFALALIEIVKQYEEGTGTSVETISDLAARMQSRMKGEPGERQ